ncbi:MAG: hypothetical protein AAF705_20275, partial [Bacteroidota bacterium]
MSLQKITRAFTEQERRKLEKTKRQLEKSLKEPIKWHYFLLAGILVPICAYLANATDIGLITFIAGTLAVLAGFFLIFMPFELVKDWFRDRRDLKAVKDLLELDLLEVTEVIATNVARAAEYEDESDLYIFELEPQKTLFFWAFFPVQNKKFPCLCFEIYPPNVAKFIGREVLPKDLRFRP